MAILVHLLKEGSCIGTLRKVVDHKDSQGIHIGYKVVVQPKILSIRPKLKPPFIEVYTETYPLNDGYYTEGMFEPSLSTIMQVRQFVEKAKLYLYIKADRHGNPILMDDVDIVKEQLDRLAHKHEVEYLRRKEAEGQASLLTKKYDDEIKNRAKWLGEIYEALGIRKETRVLGEKEARTEESIDELSPEEKKRNSILQTLGRKFGRGEPIEEKVK